jgi:hypothetical protein
MRVRWDGDGFDLIIPAIWKAKILRLVRLVVEAE